MVIQLDKRDIVQEELRKVGIDTALHYPIPLHLQPAFINLSTQAEGDFPVSEDIARKVLSLPMHPDLSNSEQDYIIECINSFMKI